MALRHPGGQRAAAFVFVTVLIDAMGIGIILPVMPEGLGALITPAMAALMSRRVASNAQGELQGTLSGVMGVILIISPALMTQTLGCCTNTTAPIYLPGAPFLGATPRSSHARTPLSASSWPWNTRSIDLHRIQNVVDRANRCRSFRYIDSTSTIHKIRAANSGIGLVQNPQLLHNSIDSITQAWLMESVPDLHPTAMPAQHIWEG